MNFKCLEYKANMVRKTLKEQLAEIAPHLDLKPDRPKDKGKSKGKTKREKELVHKKSIDKNELFSRVKDKINIKQIDKDEMGINLKKILEKERRNKEQERKIERRKKEQIHKLERRKKKKDRDFLKSIYKLIEKATDISIRKNAKYFQPELNDDDVCIAILWAEGFEHEIRHVEKNRLKELIKKKYSKNYELGRVLSARSAERISISFYERYGWKVEDVSIKQINSTKRDTAWRDYDLLIEGYSPIDVKNSRRSKIALIDM